MRSVKNDISCYVRNRVLDKVLILTEAVWAQVNGGTMGPVYDVITTDIEFNILEQYEDDMGLK